MQVCKQVVWLTCCWGSQAATGPVEGAIHLLCTSLNHTSPTHTHTHRKGIMYAHMHSERTGKHLTPMFWLTDFGKLDLCSNFTNFCRSSFHIIKALLPDTTRLLLILHSGRLCQCYKRGLDSTFLIWFFVYAWYKILLTAQNCIIQCDDSRFIGCWCDLWLGFLSDNQLATRLRVKNHKSVNIYDLPWRCHKCLKPKVLKNWQPGFWWHDLSAPWEKRAGWGGSSHFLLVFSRAETTATAARILNRPVRITQSHSSKTSCS